MKDPMRHNWNHYNDDRVTRITENISAEVKNVGAEPYILFYKKQVLEDSDKLEGKGFF